MFEVNLPSSDARLSRAASADRLCPMLSPRRRRSNSGANCATLRAASYGRVYTIGVDDQNQYAGRAFGRSVGRWGTLDAFRSAVRPSIRPSGRPAVSSLAVLASTLVAAVVPSVIQPVSQTAAPASVSDSCRPRSAWSDRQS